MAWLWLIPIALTIVAIYYTHPRRPNDMMAGIALMLEFASIAFI